MMLSKTFNQPDPVFHSEVGPTAKPPPAGAVDNNQPFFKPQTDQLSTNQQEPTNSLVTVHYRSLFVLLFMALFTVALAHRYEWFSTRASYTSCPPLTRVGKNFSYLCSCRKFSSMVNRRGLMLLLLLGGDLSLNPGPFTLGVLNARSVRIS